MALSPAQVEARGAPRGWWMVGAVLLIGSLALAVTLCRLTLSSASNGAAGISLRGSFASAHSADYSLDDRVGSSPVLAVEIGTSPADDQVKLQPVAPGSTHALSPAIIAEAARDEALLRRGLELSSWQLAASQNQTFAGAEAPSSRPDPSAITASAP